MDLRDSLYLYKETRVNLDPPSPAAIVHIKIPATSNGRRTFITKSNGNSAENFAEEERAYRVKNLATASSIFHRKHHASPRSFLWRVLNGGEILSIRAVDVCKHEKTPDANLTLHIHFPRPLRPSCVALAESESHDALFVFALDESFHLNYFLLRPDVFRKRSATEQGLGDAFRPYLSNHFGYKVPHRLVAINEEHFVVTLIDGGVMSFRRQQTHDTTTWREDLHNPTSFVQNLRSLIPMYGAPTVKYAGTNMEITAAASAAVTSLDLDDSSYLLTVCLDHRLRIWNLSRGEVCDTRDILGLQREAHEIGKWTVDPSHSNLLRIIQAEQGSCVCVTYSPVGAGAFRFWKVTAAVDGKVDVEPWVEPQQSLIPPGPSSTDVWTLADYGVSLSDDRAISLWILWKNNLIYRVTKLEFNPENIDRAWLNDWVVVHADSSIPMAQTSGPCDSTDATEKWLQLIFFPGRFSRATLETALTMYERGLGIVSKDTNKGTKSLSESICSVLGATATLERSSAGGMDYEQFRSTSETQWRRFYRLVIELDKQRGEALSLALDADSGMAWVVCTDTLAAIRACSPLDRVIYNLSSPEVPYQKISRLLTAGSTFLDSFSDGMLQLCEAALRAELYGDSSKTDPERLQFFSDKAGFWRQVTEEDCSHVIDLLGENFNAVTLDLYKQFFVLTEASDNTRSHDVRHPFTQFGQKLVIKGIQETVELHWQILFSQLVLLVHMEFEFDQPEDALHNRLDIGLVYRQLIQAMKRLELVRWLAKSEFTVALSKSERLSFSGSPSSSRRGVEETQIMTALEGSVGHLLGIGDIPGESLGLDITITKIITDVCALDSSIELDPAMIQCMLLKRERPDLAFELGSFTDQDPFATYIQGRVSLALREFEIAASHFKRAAIGLSVTIRHANRHSAGLIDDAEWNLFYSGLANFYAHIVALFDRQRAYSYVIDFAGLSLQFANGPDDSTTRTEMLARLFNASTSLSRFDNAHSALVSLPDPALQRSSLRLLVERMVERAQTAALIALPFPGLQQAVDDVLQRRCRSLPAAEVARGTVPWHQALYSWRIARNDYRGAATALLDRLRKLQLAGEGDKLAGEDVLDTPVTRTFLLLINTLACVGPKQAWICSDDLSHGDGNGLVDGIQPSVEVNGSGDEAGEEGSQQDNSTQVNGERRHAMDLLLLGRRPTKEEPWRKVVSLGDLRKEYQEELDRIAAIQNNQFSFGVDDDDEGMEVDQV